MLRKKNLHVLTRIIMPIIIAISSIDILWKGTTSLIPAVYADDPTLVISASKNGPTTYMVKYRNLSSNDIYGISSNIYGGSNQYGGNTKYIPDLAPGGEVDWGISFASPPNGSVILSTSYGTGSTGQNQTVFY